MVIVSDRHESIEIAIRKVYPEARHYLCIYHLLNNLKTHYKRGNKNMSKFFLAAAKSYTMQNFNYNMQELAKINKAIVTYLEDIVGFERWARCYSINNRGFIMTSNIAESLNAVNVAARDLPITLLLDYLRSLIQDWFFKHRSIALGTYTTLTPKYHNLLEENYIGCCSFKVSTIKPSLIHYFNH